MEICRYCGNANGHGEKCPTQQPLGTSDAAGDVPPPRASASGDAEKERIAAAREHLQAIVKERRQEVLDAVESGEIKRPEDHKAGSDEISEAREVIAELLAAKDMPKVTVDRAHLEAILREGLRERPTAYQKDVALIVGTLGRDPLLPKDEDRVILELHVDPKDLNPRFTGRTKTFEGVVAIRGPVVPPDKIKVIDPKEGRADAEAAE